MLANLLSAAKSRSQYLTAATSGALLSGRGRKFPLSAVSAIIAAVVLAVPFLVNDYIVQVAIFSINFALLGLAFAFTLQVGLPRFDASAWWGVGAYATAMLMLRVGMSFWLATLLAGLISVILGYIIFRFSIPRGMMVFLMFGMVLSLAFQQMMGELEFFGGWSGTAIVPPASIGSLQFVHKPELYYLGLGFLIFNIVIYQLLYSSRIGKSWRAIGASPQLAGSLGIDVVKYRLWNVLVGNFFLGIAGSYFLVYSRSVIPDAFSLQASVMVMMYVIVGGMGHKLSGPIIGALVLTFVPEAFRLASKYEVIFSSSVTVLIIVFIPMGLVGLAAKIVSSRRGTPVRVPPEKNEAVGAIKEGEERAHT
jgi:branched-chain amino acid transport system permease protein